MTEESDDGAEFRAQQVRKAQNSVGKGKYERLNNFGSSNHDVNPEDDSPMHGIGEGDTTPMQRHKTLTSRRLQR